MIKALGIGIGNGRHIVLCIMVVILAIAIPQMAEARSYSFPELTITAEVLEDGSMLVTENRTASFNGTFSGFFQWINKNPGEEIVDITVMENGQPYQFHPGTEFGPPGTYIVEDRLDYTYVDWSFDATDEVRTFTLTYRILDVVKVHEDVAEIYYQFIGDEWDVGVDRAHVSLILPAGADIDEIRAWGHGPLNGTVEIQSPVQVTWDVHWLAANSFLTGRVTFPKHLVSAATNKTGIVALPNILEQEQVWADEANSRRSQALVNWIVSLIIYVSGILYCYILWRRYGKAYKTDFQGDYYRELPASYTPAELGVLWRFNKVNADDLTATIMDLARRRYLRIDETTRVEKRLFRSIEEVDYKLTLQAKEAEKIEALQPHEKRLLALLFEKVSKDQVTVTFKELEEYAEKHNKHFAAFWKGWVKDLSKRGDELKFFEKHSPRYAAKYAIPVAVSIVGGIGMAVWQVSSEGQFVAVAVASIVMGFLFVLSFALHSRRTLEGQEQYAKWKAFRKFLQHFSNIDRHDIPSLVIWEHFLVYAISLGIAKEVMKQLQLFYPTMEDDHYRFGHGWYYYNANVANFSGLATNIDTMAKTMSGSIQQSIATATGQSSSGSGGGGGFSGGGGGFSGGGGGGAR